MKDWRMRKIWGGNLRYTVYLVSVRCRGFKIRIYRFGNYYPIYCDYVLVYIPFSLISALIKKILVTFSRPCICTKFSLVFAGTSMTKAGNIFVKNEYTIMSI
jgi:hypothetical protein